MRAALVLLLAACATTSNSLRPTGGSAFSRAELIDLFVHWREGERRRDVKAAQKTLYFQRSSDRSFHRRELEYIAGLPAGPICAAPELHLVGHPQGMGPGDYLFLEPVRGRYHAAFVTVVRVRGHPRFLYRRPAVTEEERQTLKPPDAARVALERHRARWSRLEGRALVAEVERTRRMLRYQIAAQAYAREAKVALTPFAPDPRDVLEELDGLEPLQVRDHIVSLLQAAVAGQEPKKEA
ncbi:MAG: hypothetical protein ACYTG3_09585 [Planctomycetota bacterium]|jgi:hypothetical protein